MVLQKPGSNEKSLSRSVQYATVKKYLSASVLLFLFIFKWIILITMMVRIFHFLSQMKKTIRMCVIFHFILFSVFNLVKSRGFCLWIIFSFFSPSSFYLPYISFAFFLFFHCHFLSLPQFQVQWITDVVKARKMLWYSENLCHYLFTQRCQRYNAIHITISLIKFSRHTILRSIFLSLILFYYVSPFQFSEPN